MTTKLVLMTCVFSSACAAEMGSKPEDRGTATVQAYEESVGASGRIAVFQDGSGRELATIATGTDGTASFPVSAGSMVTVANVGSSMFDLTTFVDVKPGDVMTIGENEAEDDHVDYGAVPVTTPAYLDAATRYDADLGLSSIELSDDMTTLHLTDHEVAPDGSFDVLAVARDASGAPVGFSIVTSRADQAGSVLTFPAWRTDWDKIQFAIANSPANTTVLAQATVVQGETGRFASSEVAPADPSSFAIEVPPGVGSELQYGLSLQSGESERELFVRGPRSGSVSIDAAAQLLPSVTAVAIDRSQDALRPVVTWQVDGDPSRADFQIVRFTWGDGASRWTVILPADHEPSLQVPALPDLLACWRPVGDLHVAVGLVELSSLADYREVLAHGVEEIEEVKSGQSFNLSQSGELGL